MTLPKHTFAYDSITEAVDIFNDRHHHNRNYIATRLGYRGPNASVQFSGALNTKSYNPANPKRLSLDQFIVILEILDEDLQRDALEKIANHFGYGLCSNNQGEDKSDTMSIVIGALDVGKSFGNLEATIRDAVADGVIDEDEAARIVDAAFKLRTDAKKVEEMVR